MRFFSLSAAIALGDPATDRPVFSAHPWHDVAMFAAGAAGAFLAHEVGHLTANAALGNTPKLVPMRGLAGLPFVAVSPNIDCHGEACVKGSGRPFVWGRRGQYLIASAGFNVQHLGNELLLSRWPRLRYERAPLAKGWLAFNVLLSVGYAVAYGAGLDSIYGDASGCASYGRLPKPAVVALLLGPALLDTYRYWHAAPDWTVWWSRAQKITFFGVGWWF